MSGVPFYYDHANIIDSEFRPSQVHLRDNLTYSYFCRYLLKKAISVFVWDLPEEWDKDFFLYVLYCFGFISVLNTDKFGVICQNCSLRGHNVYYRPTNIVVTNPLLRAPMDLTIDKNCTVIKLQPDYNSIMDIVNFYAGEMALAVQSFEMNLLNTQLAYIFATDNKATAETIKDIVDNVHSGNGAVVTDKKLFDANGNLRLDILGGNVKNNFIAVELLDVLRTIEERFCTAVGIPTANTEKKERLITDEVNANNTETRTLTELWLDTLKDGIEKTNKMFYTNISVRWRENPSPNSPVATNTESEGGNE